MQSATDPARLPNPRVLLVDDEPAVLRLLSVYLAREGYQVEQAESGELALEAIEAFCPDFLVTDWEMPGMDGLELCRRVRQLNLPHYVYIVFLTARSSSDEMVAGLEVGADDFLRKPVNPAELLARMRAGARVLELERRLSRMAHTDGLTGLANRRNFFQTLEKEWSRARRHGRPISCVMIDIDCFKRINDVHGHSTGDAVLRSVGELLARECRASDLVCRYGGEEFCVLLPETLEQVAAQWAERVRQRVASTPVILSDKELRVTCSFGTSQAHDDTQSGEQLIDQADQALLCAKRSGRDRVVRFESLAESDDLKLARRGVEGDLFHGIVARHVMTPVVVGLHEEETIGQAAEFFLRSRINSTPVVDTCGQLAGILSEKDLMAALVSFDCWRRPIREVMKPNVIWYAEETPIRTIYEFLCRVSIRRVVIAEQGRPTGTISRGTLLRWFRNQVFSKGLFDPANAVDGQPANDPVRSNERLTETARELSEQVGALQRRLVADAEAPVPHVVGGVTRMQELLDDLLAFSRYAGADAELPTLMLSSAYPD